MVASRWQLNITEWTLGFLKITLNGSVLCGKISLGLFSLMSQPSYAKIFLFNAV